MTAAATVPRGATTKDLLRGRRCVGDLTPSGLEQWLLGQQLAVRVDDERLAPTARGRALGAALHSAWWVIDP